MSIFALTGKERKKNSKSEEFWREQSTAKLWQHMKTLSLLSSLTRALRSPQQQTTQQILKSSYTPKLKNALPPLFHAQ